MKSLGFYTAEEKMDRISAESFGTDLERQRNLETLDQKVRRRLRIPSNSYYSITAAGELLLDESRDRPKPVNKISKSDQQH